MNIDEFIERAQESARKHRYHADFFDINNPMRAVCIKSAEDCEPQNNLIFEPISYNAIECKDAIRAMAKEHYVKTGANNKKTARSMIHPQYADRFIRQYILDEEIWRDSNEALQTN